MKIKALFTAVPVLYCRNLGLHGLSLCENGFPGSKYIDLEDPILFKCTSDPHRPTVHVHRCESYGFTLSSCVHISNVFIVLASTWFSQLVSQNVSKFEHVVRGVAKLL